MMAEKDIKAALRKQKNCPECLEAIGRIAALEAQLEASQAALAEILAFNKANQDRIAKLEGEQE